MARDIPRWRIKGDWFDVCNCAIGCPCSFGQAPTLGYCEGILAWHIRDGRYGTVPLDGLSVVAVVRWAGTPLDQRDRQHGFILDDRANPTQRDTLKSIFSGEAGGYPMFKAWAEFATKPVPFEVAPIRFTYTPRRWEVEVPGSLVGSGKPFEGFMVPEGATCQISNPPRPEGGPGHVVTVGEAIQDSVDVFGFRWSWPSRSSKHMEFEYSGP